MADGLHQVRLAEPHPAVEVQRVVRLAGRVGDGARGGVSELVARADDEVLEGVARVEARAALAGERRVVGGRRGGEELGLRTGLVGQHEAHVSRDGAGAAVVLQDRQNDIALLSINDQKQLSAALPLAPVSARAGNNVFTLGYPRVDILGRTPKLSTGIISSVNGYMDDPSTYQTSVQIQPGNSGGPLFNMNGEVVGVVAAMLGDTSGAGHAQPGLSYAVKAEMIHAALHELPGGVAAVPSLPAGPAGLADLAERVQAAVLLVVATQ